MATIANDLIARTVRIADSVSDVADDLLQDAIAVAQTPLLHIVRRKATEQQSAAAKTTASSERIDATWAKIKNEITQHAKPTRRRNGHNQTPTVQTTPKSINNIKKHSQNTTAGQMHHTHPCDSYIFIT